ncbi:hypothetical protein 7t3_0550 [Salmonella phage 7t3]|nr:hypothetical protein 7t3_0550 [Salmonella phage 7t3]
MTSYVYQEDLTCLTCPFIVPHCRRAGFICTSHVWSCSSSLYVFKGFGFSTSA